MTFTGDESECVCVTHCVCRSERAQNLIAIELSNWKSDPENVQLEKIFRGNS